MRQKYRQLMMANLGLTAVSITLAGWYSYRYSTLGTSLSLVYALVCIVTALSSFVNWNTYRKRYRDE